MDYSRIVISLSGFKDFEEREFISEQMQTYNRGDNLHIVQISNDDDLQLTFQTELLHTNFNADTEKCIRHITRSLSKITLKIYTIHAIKQEIITLKMFGDESTFAINIEKTDRNNCILEIFIAGKRATVEENLAYIPKVTAHLITEIKRLSSSAFYLFTYADYLADLNEEEALHKLDDIYYEDTEDYTEEEEEYHEECREISSYYSFLAWGPTTENISSYIYPVQQKLYIGFKFWKEEHTPVEELQNAYCAEIGYTTLLEILNECLDFIRPDTQIH